MLAQRWLIYVRGGPVIDILYMLHCFTNTLRPWVQNFLQAATENVKSWESYPLSYQSASQKWIGCPNRLQFGFRLSFRKQNCFELDQFSDFFQNLIIILNNNWFSVLKIYFIVSKKKYFVSLYYIFDFIFPASFATPTRCTAVFNILGYDH